MGKKGPCPGTRSLESPLWSSSLYTCREQGVLKTKRTLSAGAAPNTALGTWDPVVPAEIIPSWFTRPLKSLPPKRDHPKAGACPTTEGWLRSSFWGLVNEVWTGRLGCPLVCMRNFWPWVLEFGEEKLHCCRRSLRLPRFKARFPGYYECLFVKLWEQKLHSWTVSGSVYNF